MTTVIPFPLVCRLARRAVGTAATITTLACTIAPAATLHVRPENQTSAPPYDSWSSAATNIQDAVDAAQPGDLVLVTNGVYVTGGRAVFGGGTNRVTIDKAITVQSVNGPAVTVIEGAPSLDGGGSNGPVRCVSLGTGAILSGFTLTKGYLRMNGNYYTAAGGGAACENSAVLTNCIISGNSAGGYGGGVFGGTLRNCVITRNSASYGGGVHSATLYNCTVTCNSAYSGGGVNSATLYNCTVTGNSAAMEGGGVSVSTLYNSIAYFNEAPSGANHTGEWLGMYSVSYQPSTFYSSCTTPMPEAGEGNIVADPRLLTLSHLSDSSPCIGAGSSAYASGVDIDGEPWADLPCMGADQRTPGVMSGALTMAIKAEYLNVATGFPVIFVADNQGSIIASAWDFDDGTVVSNAPMVSHAWNAPGLYTVRLTGWNDDFPAGVTATVQVEVIDAVHYVNQANPTPQFPYTSWATAATNIQMAVEAGTMTGRLILVTNGVYASGAIQANGSNRVALLDPVIVRSVNGPGVTLIEGAPGPEGSNGYGGIRCVYLGPRAVLSGFTLTNGHAGTSGNMFRTLFLPFEATYPEWDGGGAWCDRSATLTNCILTGNAAWHAGGGSFGGTLRNCTLTRNVASMGGGASDGTLHNCAVTGNTASNGGGTAGGTHYNCTLTDNAAEFGGGAYDGLFYNCTLTFNSASDAGGGVYWGRLHNCVNYYNTAPLGANYGGEAVYETFRRGTRYDHRSPPAFYNSCTTPLPPEGHNNIDLDPQLASLTHLSIFSPCIGAGDSTYASGVDIDGESWASPPSMGADQITPGLATGTLIVTIEADYTSLATGFDVRLLARIQGIPLASRWDFDDGTVLSNAPLTRHAWNLPGSYTVRLTAYNDSFPGGVTATLQIEVIDAVHYVNEANPSPQFPYTSWETAATSIQAAIEAGNSAGRLILVTNGVYASGSVAAYGSNRVALVGPVVVRSVNGPEVTVIEGAPAPGGDNGDPTPGSGNGDGAVRCAYLGSDSILSGFTLTNGHTALTATTTMEPFGGGVLCEASATVTNCILTGNSAAYGGAVSGGTVRRSTLVGNSAYEGGGMYASILYNCDLTGNSASGEGGGSANGTLYNCTLTSNRAGTGGGAAGGNLYNCTVTDNSATYSSGGGVSHATLFNCIVYFNPLDSGLSYTANYDSKVTSSGFGVFSRSLITPTTFYHSCTTPLPPSGGNNIDADPRLLSLTHLSEDSPCLGTGSSAYASGVDIDGEPWADPPCMGADQRTPGHAFGALTMGLEADQTSVAPNFAVNFVAHIQGTVLATMWEFDDGTVTSNQLFATHAWSAAGTYTVRLIGYNDSHPEGVTATVQIEVIDAVHYVNQVNPTPQFPYTNWVTAATTIQEAIAAGTTIGRTILVSNGVYAAGIALANGTNRIALTDPVTVRSVNGPEVTTIDGTASVRCAYVGTKAVLSGFTLTNGQSVSAEGPYQHSSGGGVWCESSGVITNCIITRNWSQSNGGGSYGGTLRRCIITGNSARNWGGGCFEGTLQDCIITGNSAGNAAGGAAIASLYSCLVTANSVTNINGCGGGTAYGWLYNCVVVENSATYGGGAMSSSLYNCTLTANSATNINAQGGGANTCTLFNCVVYFNSAPLDPNVAASTCNYSCTFPLPDGGTGNITNAPVFADAAAGDFRLRVGSPGIDAGTNLSAVLTADLDGHPRPLDGDGDGTSAFDMGAYEFDARSIISPEWFSEYGLNAADEQVVSGDPDQDAFTTFQEWLMDTDPTDGLSFFQISGLSGLSPTTVTFRSSSNRVYTLWGTSQLAPPNWSIVPGQQAIRGTGSLMTLSDESGMPQRFYQVQVSLP